MMNRALNGVVRATHGDVVTDDFGKFDWTFGLGKKSSSDKRKEAAKKEDRAFNQGIKSANQNLELAMAAKRTEIVRQERIQKASTIGLWVGGVALLAGIGYLATRKRKKKK